jgi:hypothetical protein
MQKEDIGMSGISRFTFAVSRFTIHDQIDEH